MPDQPRRRHLAFGAVGVSRDTATDCRTAEGTTVGLIDSIITIARVLRHRPLVSDAELAALADLRADEDVQHLLGLEASRAGT